MPLRTQIVPPLSRPAMSSFVVADGRKTGPLPIANLRRDHIGAHASLQMLRHR